jgi:mxaA protein
VRRAFVAAVAALAISSGIVRGEDRVDITTTLRDTGYLLGDLIDERVEIRLPPGAEIDAGSLPLPGRVAPWLEVRGARLMPRDAAGTQTLAVTYQIFAETESAARVPIPEFPLRLRGATTPVVTVPAESFLLSPALPSVLTDKDRELRPSPPPMPLPRAKWIAAALASLAVALASAGWLLWRFDLVPFLPHSPGPIAKTWRRWRRRHPASADEQRALLRELHAALNGSAGETLYPSTIDRLFVSAPFLAPLRERIESVFAASWNLFYGDAGDGGGETSTSNVLALLREAADRERGVPC